jgi:thiamine biosynthesis lipoprotein
MTTTARRLRHVEHVMGTAVSFDLREGAGETALRQATAFLHWVDQTFSVFSPASEISRIASGELSVDEASPDVREVLTTCEELCGATAGLFDHRPVRDGRRRLDPSGYVKGWAVQRAAELLQDHGTRMGTITAGGDLVVFGTPPTGSWRVGIQHPDLAGAVAAVVEVASGAVATSGTYARGHHIWTDRSTVPASVTVIGPDLGIADALATAIFAAGGSVELLADRPGYEAVVIDRAGGMRCTTGVRLVGGHTT